MGIPQRQTGVEALAQVTEKLEGKSGSANSSLQHKGLQLLDARKRLPTWHMAEAGEHFAGRFGSNMSLCSPERSALLSP